MERRYAWEILLTRLILCGFLYLPLVGCFDTGRMYVDPATGSEVVHKGGQAVAPPDDPNFVGPPAPTFKDGKAAAAADFAASVKRLTWWACTLCVIAGVGMLVLSFFVPWASTKTAAWCLAGAAATLIARYILLTYGVMTADIAFWVAIATAVAAAGLVGLPMLIGYVRRIDWHNGVALAAKPGHESDAAAVLIQADPTLFPVRKELAKALEEVKSEAADVANAARERLAQFGVKP